MDFDKGKELFEEIPKSVIKGNWVTPDKSEEEDFNNQVDEENLPKVALALKAIQFTDNVTMHGMRYIFMKDMGSLRRKSKLSPSELEILHYIYGDYYYSDEEESSGSSPLTVYDEINVTQFYYDKAFDYERDLAAVLTSEEFAVKVCAPGLSQIMEFVSRLIQAMTRNRSTKRPQPPPYGVCGSVPLQTSSEYSNEKCLLECRTNYTINKCGCKDVYMPGPAKVCSFEQQYNCTMDILEPLEESDLFDASSCTCPKDCERIEYDVDVTYTEPSDDYLDMLQRWFSSEPVTERYGLRVFYNEFEYIESTQEAIYDLERLLCDIGGAAGLFLGCSFVTFFEFIDFVTEFVWLWSLRRVDVRRKNQKKEANTLT
ncbi:unnamed protein product [Clavelina lepadiformis]|uniref:Uncharacterized protein n=1 Tax=Clavelina lepadiformis TaxID=159417 RepID=A0ABP0GZR2_CLALP